MTENNNDNNYAKSDETSCYWEEQIDPKLLPIYKKYPMEINFDSWLKVKLTSLMMRIPCPLFPGVTSKSIPGVGMYCFPEERPISNYTASAIFWVHGGGRMMGGASGAGECKICSKLVTLLQIPVLSAEYRRAPRYCFPAPLDDLVAAYKWLVKEIKSKVKEEGEKVRIIVAGDSSGAGLVAELCQRLLDEESKYDGSDDDSSNRTPLPIAQVLLEPQLDDRTCLDKELTQCPPHLIWNNVSNHFSWSSYLGKDYKPGDEILPDYAAAARRKDLSGLPPAFIMVGSLDLFRNESKDYSDRLQKHGVDTDYMEIKGGFHAMLAMDNDGSGEPPVLTEIWDRIQQFMTLQLQGVGPMKQS